MWKSRALQVTYYIKTSSESDTLILGDMIHTIIPKISLPLNFFKRSLEK